MTLLIVGSKGFIGSHVSLFYQMQSGYEVYTCDVSVDYSAKNYFQIDAANADFNELFEQQKFDVCINCSGAASVPDSFVHPLRDFYLNTVNVFKLLEAIRKNAPACKFINLSSAAVYGSPVKLPVKETDPVQPLSPYGYHKLQSEQICKEFYHQFGLATCCLRIFSAYGEGLKKQLLWDLWQKINSSSVITLFGTGNETRDFINIKDLVNAIDCILRQAAYQGEIYNVANGLEVKIKTIADIYQKNYHKEVIIRFSGEERKGDPVNWQADIHLLKSLGYQQTMELEDGIAKYIQWAKDQK